MPKKYKDLYVLMMNSHILTPDVFKEYWRNYGSGANGVYGWRPPKKVYYTLGHARAGLSHVPKEIKDKVYIARFSETEVIQPSKC